jgi:nucleoside-diphosphate-sugar epimerase
MFVAPEFERVVITGGTGFIGRHLVSALVQLGISPIVFTRSIIEQVHETELKEQANFLEVDLLDQQTVFDLFLDEEPDVVFHLAGSRGSGTKQESYLICSEANFKCTVKVIEAAQRANVSRIVTVGSAEEYGNQPGPLNEEMTLIPNSAYGLSKVEATKFALFMHSNADVPVTVLRPFSVYGPHQSRETFVAEAVRCAVKGLPFEMTEGTQKRDLIYVDDVVNALLVAANSRNTLGQVFNIGSGGARALREVAELIWTLTGSDPNLLKIGARIASPDELHNVWADISKAKTMLKWQPQISLEEGLRKTIEWEKTRT